MRGREHYVRGSILFVACTCIHFSKQHSQSWAVRGLFCWVFMILGILSLAYAETEERWGPFLMWLWCCCFCLLVRWSGQMLEKHANMVRRIRPLIPCRSRLEYSPARIPMLNKRTKLVEMKVNPPPLKRKKLLNLCL